MPEPEADPLYCHFQGEPPWPRSVVRLLWERHPEVREAFLAAGVFVVEFEALLEPGYEVDARFVQDAQTCLDAAYQACPPHGSATLLFIAHTDGHTFRELADAGLRAPEGVFLGVCGYVEGGIFYQGTDGTFVDSDDWDSARDHALRAARRHGRAAGLPAEPAAPARAGSRIRLFLSSTFRDMHAERDWLSRVVFPELRSRCQRRGADFVGFDLRWGLTEEEAEQEGALALCLREIERCRPFFVCLLGERFGWVPPPDEVPTFVYQAVREQGELPEEIAAHYRLDETTDPPVYRLRRGGRIPEEQSEALVRFWESRGLPLAGDSITAREILRGVFEDGYPPTRAFFYLRRPGLTQHPAFPAALVPAFVEQDERRRQRLADLKERIRGLRGEVRVRDYEAAYAGLRIDPALLPTSLVAAERAALEDGVVAPEEWPRLGPQLQAALDAHGTLALHGMRELGERILADVWPAIEAELDRPVEQQDPHQRERAYHKRFVRDRSRLFVGRGEALRRITRYLEDRRTQGCAVVTGAPGSGKSALMAEAVRQCRESSPGSMVIPHFVGAAPGSAALPATLRSLCEALRRPLGLLEPVATDPQQLRRQFAWFLGQAEGLVVFLDGLDQLDPAGRGHELDWIPHTLPPGVKLVASALPGDCLDQMMSRAHGYHVIEVPPLPDFDRRGLIESFLEERRKRLTPAQVERLLDASRRPDARLPLYLLVALEELCLFGDHHALDRRIEALPPRLTELFDQVLARLEHDHGRRLTESVCAWLAVSRSGLLESELLDLIDPAVGPGRLRWAALYRALEPYLKPLDEEERGLGLLDYYHDQLRLAAYRRYLEMEGPGAPSSEASRRRHRQLAAYFRSPERPDRARALGELVHHHLRGEDWEALEATLCDLDFVAARCAAGQTYGLVAEYEAALLALPEAAAERDRERALDEQLANHARRLEASARRPDLPAPPPPPARRPWSEAQLRAESERIESAPDRQDRIRAFGQFVSAHSHLLERFGNRPGFCLQEAYNHTAAGPLALAARRHLASWAGPPLLLRLAAYRPAVNAHPPCLRVLEGHGDAVRAVALTLDGRRVVSGGGDIGGGGDASLRVWDPQTGQCLGTLEGHTAAVTSVAVTVDGRRALSGSEDGSLRLWDIATGQCLSVLEGHAGAVAGVAVAADGRRAVSVGSEATGPWSDPGTLRVWDLATGQAVRTIPLPRPADEARYCEVQAVALTLDSRRAATGGREGTVRVWDLETGDCTRELVGHTDWVHAVALTQDGRRVISGGGDRTLRVWDLETGEPRGCIEGFADGIASFALSADGQLAACACGRTIEIRDLQTGGCLKAFEAPDTGAIALLGDGRRAVTGDRERGVRVWDIETGHQPARHAGDWWLPVHALALAGPRRAVSTALEKRIGPDALVSGAPGVLRVWDVETGRCLKAIGGHGRALGPLALTSDGARAVTGFRLIGADWVEHDEPLHLWDLVAGRCVRHAPRAALAEAVALTPDDRRAIAGRRDGSLGIWDLESGQWLATLAGHTDWVTAVALTAGGAWAVSGSRDSTLRVWDLETGVGLAVLQGHTGWVEAVAVAPDGRRAVSGGSDAMLRVWDLDTGRTALVLEGHERSIHSIAITGDGQRAVSGSEDNSVRVWDLQTGQCLMVLPVSGLEVSAVAGDLVVVSSQGRLEAFQARPGL
jgi:WD40 repeat protein